MGEVDQPEWGASRRMALAATLMLVGVILLLTLWPLPEFAYKASLSPVTCLVCGGQGMQDVFQNIVMFFPLGVALRLSGRSIATAVLVGFLLSLLVETMQYFVIPGRDASLSDLLTNTTGAFLGAVSVPLLFIALRPSEHQALRLGIGAALLWGTLWVFGAWAVGNDPRGGNFRGRFPNEFPDTPMLTGDAIAATFNHAPLGSMPASLPPQAAATFARDSFFVDATVRPAPTSAWRENIISIIDFKPGEPDYDGGLVFVVSRTGRWSMVGYRINAARLWLRTPSYRMASLYDSVPGGPVHFRITRAAGMLTGTREGNDAALVRYRIGPELLYSSLLPRSPNPTLAWRIEAFIWAAALAALSAWWAVRSRSTPAILFTLALFVGVQLLVPLGFPVAPQSLLGWLMVMGGWGIGAGIGWVGKENGERRMEKG